MSVETPTGVQTDNLLADQLCTTVESLQRSTVHVRSGRAGSGSGVIWRRDGLIVTNAHVARGPSASVELWDGRVFEADVTSRDVQRDLAALTIDASDLPAVSIGNSDRLRVGQLVAAVGNPLGLSGALTLGIIHAIAPAEGHGRERWVQADVRLAPGNSGGPLADIEGRVIGVNSMIAGGLGLAVPSNTIQRFLQVGAPRPWLGVTSQPVAVSIDGRPRPGLLVLEVRPGSAADAAGILLGDVLVGARGRLFERPEDLPMMLQEVGAGGRLALDLIRSGQRITRDVDLGDTQTGGVDNKEAA